MMSFFSPGQYVCHPDHPEWGLGQVQSSVIDRVTVNFEHVGKQLIIAGAIDLKRLSDKEVQEYRTTRSNGKNRHE
jgi:Protein of unknown function (DUF3553)